MPDKMQGHPALWRQHLDSIMEPVLSPEEQAEADAEEAAYEAERLERLAETWGTSPAELAGQEALMAMAGGEG